MSDGLFISLYLDEDVSVLVAAMIRARGFEVLTTVEAGNLGASDEEQLSFATSIRSVLLTHNRVDFEKLAVQRFQTEIAHPGIVIAARHPPGEIARRLLRLLNEVTASDIADQVRYI